MPTIGGESEQLSSLKANFDRQSANISELMSSIDGQLGNTYWVGPAAERFKASWNGEFKRMLTSLQQSLTEAGTEVARRRDALIQAGS